MVELQAGYVTRVGDFLLSSRDDILQSLRHFSVTRLNESPGDSQLTAWRVSIDILHMALAKVITRVPDFAEWHVIFEYELPRERGRRPDVILLGRGFVQVIEFKDSEHIRQAHIDQVQAYSRDIAHYHAESHELMVDPLLVLTRASDDLFRQAGEVSILGSAQLGPYLADSAMNTHGELIDSDRWLASDYSPLPTLIHAAKIIFEHDALPQIRRAQSAGIPAALQCLDSIAERALAEGEKHLALVTGVPGAGKTLVGIQLVYSRTHSDEQASILLSGNGPLVEVLQYALKSRVFVRDVHGFLRTYGGKSSAIPRERIIVFDEAQRAWDKERVSEKRNHTTSEPEDFLRIAAKAPEGVLLVGLIGEGQEIHLGEEAGLTQWDEAIRSVGGEWHVHGPSHVRDIFISAHYAVEEALNLTATLRSHLASDVQKWVDDLLNGHIADAQRRIEEISASGFSIYVTRNLTAAKDYLWTRYADEVDKRYGLIASSKAKNLAAFGVDNTFSATRVVKQGPWYVDEPSSPLSCCALTSVVTEFGCQGLELDFPLVCWGNDLVWDGTSWITHETRSKAKNPYQLRVNSYRVLLTRGRDGMIIFVPPDDAMESTFQVLQAAGAIKK